MDVGLVKAVFPGERRVALLPEHTRPGMVVEAGYGHTLGIPDAAYEGAGCLIATREDTYQSCEAILNLKLTPRSDYSLLRPGQRVWGWTHPNGSGRDFARGIATDLNLHLFDLDSVHPTVHADGEGMPIAGIPSGFLRENSWIAGYAAVTHAAHAHGLLLGQDVRVAVLGTGAVAQGAMTALCQSGVRPRVFNRRTLPELRLADYDVIVSGIESDAGTLITRSDLDEVTGLLVVDAAADAGGTIEGTRYTTLADPIYELGGNWVYCVNNTPSLYHRTASRVISRAFAQYVVPLLCAPG